MSAENQKVVNPDETQNIKQTVNRSRRSFAKAGAVAPVIMTLASRTALGAGVLDCTPTGLASGNNSSHQNRDESKCKTGCSPQTWCDHSHINDGTTPGGCHHWKAAGVCPTDVNIEDKNIVTITEQKNRWGQWVVASSLNTGSLKRRRYTENRLTSDDTDPSTVCDPIVSRWQKQPVAFVDNSPVYSTYQYSNKNNTRTRTKTSIVAKTAATATLCNEILGNSAPNTTCRDELLKGTTNSMEAVAITDYLNCASGQGPEGVTADMIKQIYICYKNGAGTYTSASGVTIDYVKCGEFLKAICPT